MPKTADVEDQARRRLTVQTAAALFIGAGLVSGVNSAVASLPGVDVTALRVDAALALVTGVAVLFLPWQRWSTRALLACCVLGAGMLVVGDSFHHYSRTDSALVVYPVFFIVICAWAGISQPRGVPALLAPLLAAGLAFLLYNGGHRSAAFAAVLVTVPTAALLGEVIAWAVNQLALASARNARMRDVLGVVVSGTTELQHALTPAEAQYIVCECAQEIFGSDHVRFDEIERPIDVVTEDDGRMVRIPLRGQAGTLASVVVAIDGAAPDSFVLDVARLFGEQVGTRLEQLRVIEALTDAATIDALTGVGNRRAAERRLASLQPGDVVLLFDLDRFKRVNDEDGHRAGDVVLAEFGEFLRRNTRSGDDVARYGGEEFVVVARALSAAAAERLADRFICTWRALQPRTTFSLGLARHEQGASPSTTFERADRALYRAKDEGRDRWCAADPSRAASTHTG